MKIKIFEEKSKICKHALLLYWSDSSKWAEFDYLIDDRYYCLVFRVHHCPCVDIDYARDIVNPLLNIYIFDFSLTLSVF